MADVKISELTAHTTPQNTDVIPIVDNSGTPMSGESLFLGGKLVI